MPGHDGLDLGQAGFSEQLQLYGEAFWREVGSTVLWTFVVIWAALMLVAVVVTLSRQVAVNEEMGSARGLDELLRKTRTGSLRSGTAPAARSRRPTERKAA